MKNPWVIICFLLSVLMLPPITYGQVQGQVNEQFENNNGVALVHFLENKGQMTDYSGQPVPFVLFKAEAPGVNLYITETGLTFTFTRMRKEKLVGEELLQWERDGGILSGRKSSKKYFDWNCISMTLEGATIKKENVVTNEADPFFTQYFYGHCPDGISDVKSYQKITITNIYPGIDWVFYNSSENGFKYDFIIHPGADIAMIKMCYESRKPIQLDDSGNLQMTTDYGSLLENKPVSYFSDDRVEVPNNFEILSSDSSVESSSTKMVYRTVIGFNARIEHDRNEDFIIDPELTWSTLFGSNSVEGSYSLDTDPSGNIFITGYTYPDQYPMFDSGNFFDGSAFGNLETYITKFSNNGNLLWSTFYGGIGDEVGYSVCTDPLGNIYLVGQSDSPDFPLQDAGGYFQASLPPYGQRVYIVKFDNDGNRLYATLFGGGIAYNACTDIYGNLLITGHSGYAGALPLYDVGTFFQDMPSAGSFIAKFDPDGNQLWATCYGQYTVGHSITTDLSGNILVSGYFNGNNFPYLDAGTFFQGTNAGGIDGYVCKFDSDGNQLWSTAYGGTDEDNCYNVRTDADGNIFVLGHTYSVDFPLQDAGTFFQSANNGQGEAFLLKFDAAGNRIWATYFGGSDEEYVDPNYITFDNLEVDECGNVYMAMHTASTDMVTQPSMDGGYCDISHSGGPWNVYVGRFSNDGDFLWGSYVGGDGNEFRSAIGLDSKANLFITGEHQGYTTNYPFTDPGGGAIFDTIHNVYPDNIDDLYIWKFDFPDQVIVSVSTTDADCNEDGTATVMLSGSVPPYSYSWSTGDQLLSTIDTFHTINNLPPGYYYVTVEADGCTFTAALEIMSKVTSSASIEICPGDSVLLNGQFISNPGVYADTLANAAIGGCDSIIITTLNNIWLPSGHTTITICNGDSILLGGAWQKVYGLYLDTISGGGVMGCDSVVEVELSIFTALPGDSVIYICEGDSILIEGIYYTSQGPLFLDTLSGASSNGCDSTIAVYLTYYFVPTGVTFANICPGDSMLIGGIYRTAPGTYTDTLQNVSVNGCDSMVEVQLTYYDNLQGSESVGICPGDSVLISGDYITQPGVFQETLLNATVNGCDSTTVFQVVFYPTPVFTLIKENDTCSDHTGTIKTVLPNTADQVNFEWNNGQISSSISNLPAGIYTVTVTNGYGCKDSMSAIVENISYDCESFMLVPNVFTPGDDGVNDVFLITTHRILLTNLLIVNRWGDLIYESTNPSSGWDGTTMTGENATAGVYFFVLDYTPKHSEPQQIHGSITLVK